MYNLIFKYYIIIFKSYHHHVIIAVVKNIVYLMIRIIYFDNNSWYNLEVTVSMIFNIFYEY